MKFWRVSGSLWGFMCSSVNKSTSSSFIRFCLGVVFSWWPWFPAVEKQNSISWPPILSSILMCSLLFYIEILEKFLIVESNSVLFTGLISYNSWCFSTAKTVTCSSFFWRMLYLGCLSIEFLRCFLDSCQTRSKELCCKIIELLQQRITTRLHHNPRGLIFYGECFAGGNFVGSTSSTLDFM